MAIGRAIVREPSIYLFDEPLSNLDAELRVATRVELKALHERLGNTMIYVTHDQVEAMTLGHRLVLMNEGRIEQIGEPLQVYESPQTLFVAGFIGSPPMNLVSGEVNEKGEFDLGSSVNIKLDDFVLIDTPTTLKLLSLPSISGVVSIAEGEPGIRFGYGEIKYTETEDLYSNIEAFAVSDSLGLVMDRNIDRNKKTIDMKGEISPMHLVNAIIQKLPIIGNILVGDEGEGMFSIDFTLSGDQYDPDVDSVPLSIIFVLLLNFAVGV